VSSLTSLSRLPLVAVRALRGLPAVGLALAAGAAWRRSRHVFGCRLRRQSTRRNKLRRERLALPCPSSPCSEGR